MATWPSWVAALFAVGLSSGAFGCSGAVDDPTSTNDASGGDASIGGGDGPIFPTDDARAKDAVVDTRPDHLAEVGVTACTPDPAPTPPPRDALQWWNTPLTYGPYMSSSGWWDTDLAVSHDTPVQLRHDSRLDKTGVYAWGYMPEFTDLATGKRFRFLHLRPAHQNATEVGKVYPCGFIVGLSGGDTADTGLGTYSTGAHLCVQTPDTYRATFPSGVDGACPVPPPPKPHVRGVTGDFNGDRFADFADESLSDATFFVHLNKKTGGADGFDTANWGTGKSGVDGWETFVGDFTGDGYADYADHNVGDGGFFVHENMKDGTFHGSGTDWGKGTTAVGANWETLIGDFTGDGYADYADHDLTTGQLFVHENMKDGTFHGSGSDWGHATTAFGDGWETLVADFTGDGYADYADHDLGDRTFFIHENKHDGTFAAAGTNWGEGATACGGGGRFETLVGDFTGDGFADYADHDLTTGTFWVHRNREDGAFDGSGVDWGTGKTATSGWAVLGYLRR